MTLINRLFSTDRPPQRPPTLTQARMLADPYYRFKSLEEVELAAALGIQIDVNQASVDDWLKLPGLSIHQARSLVQLTQAGVQLHCLEDIAAILRSPLHRLKPLEPVLQFCYYDPESICAVEQVNPNTASLEALTRVPLIDTIFAKAVVHNRLAEGPYRDLVDFQKRLYVPGHLLTELIHYLYFW